MEPLSWGGADSFLDLCVQADAREFTEEHLVSAAASAPTSTPGYGPAILGRNRQLPGLVRAGRREGYHRRASGLSSSQRPNIHTRVWTRYPGVEQTVSWTCACRLTRGFSLRSIWSQQQPAPQHPHQGMDPLSWGGTDSFLDLCVQADARVITEEHLVSAAASAPTSTPGYGAAILGRNRQLPGLVRAGRREGSH
ncbi:hypothetical protein O0L34_g13145 [Tuta absoluta]|nr:hypothetical protein O0L34_g13145 [Tuta absoluta]